VRNAKDRGGGAGGGTNGCLKRKDFFKNKKHEPKKYLVDCNV